ncbi:MAG: autotransporter outer membrane beta-barrel domain-containing protein, partial [Selenomonas sp.]|nr:autotransporter outer membrane beta-barrel domain-containing protein [Selenomonas sp.]
VYGGSGGTSASGNTVTIGGTAKLGADTNIYGGEATEGTAANNTVNILIPMTVAGLYGGIGDAATSTGNTLNLAAKNVNAASIGGFQNMNFYLPPDIANNDTMLTINGGSPTDVQGVTFGVAALQGVTLAEGNTVNLLTNESGLTTDATLKTTDSATLGKATFLAANNMSTNSNYELSISKDGANKIIARVDKVTEEMAEPDQMKSPVETRAGVVTMINTGSDIIAGQGMDNAAAAVAASGGQSAPFAAMGGSSLRAESGSHVDTKGFNIGLGFAKQIENKSGKLLIGPILEYGHGSYDSYQDNGITADGKSSYWGIGVIAKQTNNSGFYYEGSLRVGRTKSDYGSNNAIAGSHLSYDSKSTFWAAHLGAGKLVDIGHDNTLDYYGKYFYSHTAGDDVGIYRDGALFDSAKFDAVNSHRLRVGARVTHTLNEKNKIYGGLAYQYEFKGDARATYQSGGTAPSPSVKGGSGMLELGWQVKPGSKSPLTIDLGVTGWAGKQRGITANLQANWTF